MARLYYTPGEVAEVLHISNDAVLDLINRNEMPAFRISPRITRIPIAAFDLWRSGVRPTPRRVTIRPARREVVVGADEQLPVGGTLARR